MSLGSSRYYFTKEMLRRCRCNSDDKHRYLDLLRDLWTVVKALHCVWKRGPPMQLDMSLTSLHLTDEAVVADMAALLNSWFRGMGITWSSGFLHAQAPRRADDPEPWNAVLCVEDSSLLSAVESAISVLFNLILELCDGGSDLHTVVMRREYTGLHFHVVASLLRRLVPEEGGIGLYCSSQDNMVTIQLTERCV